MGRVRQLWWPTFLQNVNNEGTARSINKLDVYMEMSRDKLLQMAKQYAEQFGKDGPEAKRTQLTNQFLKSNTGKMFERFVGLSIAHVLKNDTSDYCILPFTSIFRDKCPALRNNGLKIQVVSGAEKLPTQVDADLFAFNPSDSDADIFLISVKSTLKDRFHNVPFWNLLRQCAVSGDFPNIIPQDKGLLKRIRYVAICTDLAEEQPDFARDEGPRNLLQIDAALLDGAFVTASRAKGVISSANCLGPRRDSAWNWLSDFVKVLCP